MTSILLLLLAGPLPVRAVPLSREALAKPVRIECPVGQVTEIVFPEAFLPGGVKASPGATDALGVVLKASRPFGVVRINPQSHPARGTLELRGQNVLMTVVLITSADGVDSQVRMTLAGRNKEVTPPPPAPKSASIVPPETPAPRPSPEPTTSAPGDALEPLSAGPALTGAALTPAGGSGNEATVKPSLVAPSAPLPIPPPLPAVDVEGLLLARSERIGRREGLPGQPQVTLDDALKSDRWVWLRFTLPGGDKTAVEALSWEHGPIERYQQYMADKTHRLIIQLPRDRVSKRTRVHVRLKPGGEYRFALSAPRFSSFLRDLF